MNQEDFDKEIRNKLNSFLLSNNSISGVNFKKLIDDLIEFDLKWQEEVKQYIQKINE